MNRIHRIVYGLGIGLLLIPALALAQGNDCMAVIQAAFTSAAQSCSVTGRDQACFGSPHVEATQQADLDPFVFSQVGNLIDARAIQSLRSTLDADSYGVFVIRIQANLPEQNATLLAFGDVELQNMVSAADAQPTLNVYLPSNINLRSGPSTDDALMTTLGSGQTVTASGRLGDSSWLRVAVPEVGFGWLYSPLVATNGDINTLDIVDSSGAPVALRYGPMQSFSFRSGVGDAPCAGTPASGVLLQTPAETQDVIFSINGVELHVGGTVFLQAQPGGEMRVNALEGVSRVGALGVTHVMLPGSRVRIQLDANRAPTGAPLEPEPYDAAALQMLPLGILGREFALPSALTPEAIAAAGIPTAGEWATTYTLITYNCADGRTDVAERFRSNPLTIQVEDDGAAIVLVGSELRDDPPFAPVTLMRRGAGFYTATATLENALGRQTQYEFTVYVLSPTRLAGVTVGQGGDCATTGPFAADLVTASAG